MERSDPRAPDAPTAAVVAAREELLAEFVLEDTPLGAAFLAAPAGPRLRAGQVRAGFGRFLAELLAAAPGGTGIAFGGFTDASDELILHVPAQVGVRPDLAFPVLAAVTLKLAPLAYDLAAREPGIVAAELLARHHPPVRELERRLRAAPPTYAGWAQLSAADIARIFPVRTPLISDRQEIYRRLQLACTIAAEREVIDGLARINPGILDYLRCFPVARALKRKVVAWLGPTNSGKTHRAMLALAAAPGGMYLGPLRLLALEQRDRLVELGTPCSLITGEERIETSPTHSSRTVEMADFSRQFSVCVLDEMQLAFDRDRGWAWVAAFCGIAAETLIITGPASAEAVIRKLGGLCGDDIEINHLERQGRLAFEGVIDWRHVPPRSAVIGFSRAMVLELKAMFEGLGLSVAVIYGGLSPEVRRQEARRFREADADIVCATDAIGLGLNLPLERVIFYETDKFDGENDRPLLDGELLQIAGRAGRGPGATGWVAAFSERDARRLESALAQPQTVPPPDRLPAAPTPMHIRAIAEHLGLDRLVPILEFFRARLTFSDGTFFPEVRNDVLAAAALADTHVPSLPVETRYALACTPVDLENETARGLFLDWLDRLEAGVPVKFPARTDRGGLEALEETLQLVTVYRWLALKFPETFTDLEHVDLVRREVTEQTQAILRRNWGEHGLARRECQRCGRAMLPGSSYRFCRACYR